VSWKDKSDDPSSRLNGQLSEGESRAICAQTKAFACAKMGCCATKENTDEAELTAGEADESSGRIDALREWVMAQEALAPVAPPRDALQANKDPAFGGGVDVGSLALPVSSLPLPRCEHDPLDQAAADLACGSCKARLRLNIEALPEASWCSALAPTSLGFHPNTQTEKDKTHYSLYDRCMAVAGDIVGALAGKDVKDWQNERMCKCAGCCQAAPESKSNQLKFAAADCPFPSYALV
jgi:hypothetical protein